MTATMIDSILAEAAALRRAGHLIEAQARLTEAQMAGLTEPRLLALFGGVLRDQGRTTDAVALLARVAPLVADPSAMIELAAAQLDLGQPDAAEAALALAAPADPQAPTLLLEQARLDILRADPAAAAASLRAALARQPDFPEAQIQLAVLLLTDGDFAQGFALYEARWHLRQVRAGAPQVDAPLWDGSPLSGTLLLMAEQGLGDVIQFIRLARLARARAGRVLVEAPPRLIRLLREVVGIDGWVARGAARPGVVDAWLPLMSLPHRLALSLDDLPADSPYLTAEPDLVAKWRGLLASAPGMRIGIAWQGNPRHAIDRGRSPPLAAFAPLAALPGVRLIALQQQDGLAQLDDLPPGMTVETLPEPADAGPDAFIDSAAVMAACDLIISSDTAIAHLAGALGRPVWIALPYQANWRWLRDRDDTPWYPTARLYRQPAPGDWAGVAAAMAGDLAGALSRRPA